MYELIQGDCLAVLKTLADNSIDAVVTDPPYGLEFMGKDWDSFKTGRASQYAKGGNLDRDGMASRSGKGGAGPSYVNRPAKRCKKCGKQAWSGSPCECVEKDWELDNSPLHAFQSFSEAWARGVYRVLKPGGHCVAFSGTRTYHRMACAIEDAGFEVRDQLAWCYGTGFPKSHDVSKGIDKAAGVAFEARPASGVGFMGPDGPGGYNVTKNQLTRSGESTAAARQWEGWGTALKPAWEPICLARKPLSEKTVAANVLRWGTGAINVDGCRIGLEKRTFLSKGIKSGSHNMVGSGWDGNNGEKSVLGRFPANLCHDGSQEVLDLFPETKSGGGLRNSTADKSMFGIGAGPPRSFAANSGSAARFFYCAKASKADRADSRHPTVKPIKLMQWLCRMVTPPSGTILDPFAGSGTTGAAAILEGFKPILIEREDEYVRDIRRRLAA